MLGHIKNMAGSSGPQIKRMCMCSTEWLCQRGHLVGALVVGQSRLHETRRHTFQHQALPCRDLHSRHYPSFRTSNNEKHPDPAPCSLMTDNAPAMPSVR